ELHRPLLSHSELSVVADNPSSLFDALTGVLGLDELSDAAEMLRKGRLEAEKPLKAVRKELTDDVLPTLAASEDERAAAVGEALSGRSWDLDTAGAVAAGTGSAFEGTDALGAIARLALPAPDEVEAMASALEEAVARRRNLEGSEAGRSRRSIDLLEAALAEHADHGDQPCPVCGTGSLDPAWRRRAEQQVEELRRSAADYDAASQALDQASGRAKAAIRPVPPELSEPPSGLEIDSCRETWQRWASPPEDPTELAG